jgi:hypothetical protein
MTNQQNPSIVKTDIDRDQNDNDVVVMQSDTPPKEVKLIPPLYSSEGNNVVLKRCEEPVLPPHVSWLNPGPLFIGCTAVYACKAGYVCEDGRPFVLSTCDRDGKMTVSSLPGCKGKRNVKCEYRM